MKICFTWDDGALEDKKLFALHEKYNIPGMFFVPTHNREGRAVLSRSDIKAAANSLISFGGHTQNHTYLTNIPLEKVPAELQENKDYLEDILGKEVPHFCLPGGKYNADILQTAFSIFKTVRTADTMNFAKKTLLCKPTFHIYPRGYKSLLGNALRQVSYKEFLQILCRPRMNYFDLLRDLIRYEKNYAENVLLFWGHSWEIEQFDLWEELGNLFKEIGSYNIVSYDRLFCERMKK